MKYMLLLHPPQLLEEDVRRIEAAGGRVLIQTFHMAHVECPSDEVFTELTSVREFKLAIPEDKAERGTPPDYAERPETVQHHKEIDPPGAG